MAMEKGTHMDVNLSNSAMVYLGVVDVMMRLAHS